LRRQKPPRTRSIAWRIPSVARITAHAGSENFLRPSPSRSHTLTSYPVRCALPRGIPIFFGVEKSIPHPGPLPACNDTFFSFRVSRAGIFNGLSARDTCPLRIPLGRLGAAASPTDKPRKYGALPPVIPKRHHYPLVPGSTDSSHIAHHSPSFTAHRPLVTDH
jgi:hypothetical protein